MSSDPESCHHTVKGSGSVKDPSALSRDALTSEHHEDGSDKDKDDQNITTEAEIKAATEEVMCDKYSWGLSWWVTLPVQTGIPFVECFPSNFSSYGVVIMDIKI